MLLLLQGPAGGGKSQVYRELINDGIYDFVADYTAIWAAIGNHVRQANGLYAVRQSTEPIVESGLVSYIQRATVRQGLRNGLDGIVTTSRRGMEQVYADIANETGTVMEVRTIDPGRETVTQRLAAQNGGSLLPECEAALNRWY